MGYWKNVKMGNDEVDQVVEWLKETALEAAQKYGGYPPQIARVESHVVIAGLDHDESPSLLVYCGDAAVQWRAAALGSLELDPDWADSMVDAMEETRPEECSCGG